MVHNTLDTASLLLPEVELERGGAGATKRNRPQQKISLDDHDHSSV
jgi:hypothetical protein